MSFKFQDGWYEYVREREAKANENADRSNFHLFAKTVMPREADVERAESYIKYFNPLIKSITNGK